MSKRTLLWLVPAAAYLAFTIWYTDLSGALTPAEVDAYEQRMLASGAAPEQARVLRAFLEQDSGRQFVMVNIIDVAEDPAPISGATIPRTAADYLGHYMEHMYPALLSRACHPIFAGEAVHRAMDLAGIDGAEQWDQAALMRYRSRRDLAEIATNPAFRERHDFKIAALTKTIAYPVETVLYLSDPRLLLLLVLLALTALIDIALYGRRHAS